jgi:hypothetical protein
LENEKTFFIEERLNLFFYEYKKKNQEVVKVEVIDDAPEEITITSQVVALPLEKVYNFIKNQQSHIAKLCVNNSLKENEVLRYLDEFFKKLENEGEEKKSIKDAKSHFARWLNLELEKKNKPLSAGEERMKRMEGVRQLKKDSEAILNSLGIKM